MTHQFPYFLCRIGGESFEQLARLEISIGLRDDLQQLFKRHQLQDEQRNELCDHLHQSISERTDPKEQNQLLNLKRTLFNKRQVKQKELEAVDAFIATSLKDKLQHFYTEQESISVFTTGLGQRFDLEMINSRDQLKQVAQEENLQKGLLLSSQLLLNNIPSLIERESSSFRKKELKTEESLVKYLTRMCAKTSPFSTFTNLSMGTVNGKTGSGMLGEKAKTINSHICLNNYLFGFFKSVFIHLPEVYRQFRLRLNPTIRVEGETYLFLTNSNNIEAFQRISGNPVVELFHELIKDHADGIVFGELVQDIITNEYFDAEAEEIEAYINQLVSYGFIEFHIGVSGIDPFWDKTLIGVLEPLQNKAPILTEAIEVLKQVRELATRYENANVAERRQLLNQAHQQLRDLAWKLHEAAGLPEEERQTPEERQRIAAEKKTAEGEKKEEKSEETETKTEEETFTHQSSTYFHFKPEQIFYEDTSANIQPQLNPTESAGIVEPLDKLLHGLQDFDGMLDEMEKMLKFFENKYGLEAEVDIMQFYEDLYREVKRPEADAQAKYKEQKEKDEKAEMPVILAVPETEKRQQTNKTRLDGFIANINDTIQAQKAQVDFKLDHIGNDLLNHTTGYLRSYGAFVQPFRENGKLKAVINSGFPGYGKMFSRFLHLLPAELTSTIRSWNQPQSEREIFIENCDASFFNANLHPPLLPYEVWMPGGQNTLPASEQIPVTDLKIVFDKEKNQLLMKHSTTGKEAYAFDLGFQGQRGRSPLFQLLSRLTLIKALFWQHLTQSVNIQYKGKEEKNNEPTIQPRIVLEETVVLQRQSWWFKKAMIPQLQPTESEWDYFLKIDLWRKQWRLPDEVFIFITNHGELQSLKPEEMKGLGRDSYKPQYINFNSPILVCNLMEKMMVKCPVGARFEEMLPNSSQMEKIGDKRYVTELVMQWYNNSPN